MWLNAFPRKGGFITTIITWDIIGGQNLQYPQHIRAEFGYYVQTHQYNQQANRTKYRTLGVICLGTTGNGQGTHRFYILRTGKMLTRNHRT